MERKCTSGVEFHRARRWVLLCLRFLMNDLPSSIKSGHTFMYAYDTMVFCVGSSQGVTCNLLNRALEELSTWCVNNRNSIIEYKAPARLLGMSLDQNLSWIPHLKKSEAIQVSTQTCVRGLLCEGYPANHYVLCGLGLVRQSYLIHRKYNTAMLLEYFFDFYRTCQRLMF